MKGSIINNEMIKKRFKSIGKGKVSVTESVLVFFLITGSLGYCDDFMNGIEKKVGLTTTNELIYQNEDITVDSGIGITSKGKRGIVENTDSAIIRVNGNNSVGVYGEGSVTNRGEIIVSEGVGIELTSNSKGNTNQIIGKIDVSNGGIGVKVNPSKGRFDNLGQITATGKNSIGIYTEAIARNVVGQITVVDGTGIKVGKSGTAINMSAITANNSGAFAMHGIDGGQILNEATGVINGSTNKAIEVSGKGSTATNKGVISNTGSYGMYAIDEGIVINDVAGTILNTGVSGMGAEGVGSTAINRSILNKQMKALKGGTIVNEGTLNHSGTYAMEATDAGSTAINKSAVVLTKGMNATNGGIIINETIGTITKNGNNGMSASGVGARAINRGTLSNAGDYAMLGTSGAHIENWGILSNTNNYALRVQGLGSYGINEGRVENRGLYGISGSSGSTIVNGESGEICNIGENGLHTIDPGTTGINKGKVYNASYSGFYVNFGVMGLNDTTGEIYNVGGNGMTSVGNGSVATNKGKIYNTGDNGLYSWKNGAHAINEGIISNGGTSGMRLDANGTITNEVGGEILNKGSQGMSSETNSSGTLINRGKIMNLGSLGMDINGTSTGTNDTSGMIANTGDIGIAVNKGTGINKGVVSNTGDYGIKAGNKGKATNEGVISNTGDYGMYADGALTEGINKGTISNEGNYGVYATAGAIITNDVGGEISNVGDYGMFANGLGSTGINNGTINNGGPNKTGTAGGGVITNNVSGKIYVTEDNGVGMTANGSGSIAINKGDIIMTGNNQKGMIAKNGATIKNDVDGEIYLSSANNSVGLYASGIGSAVRNDGTIYLDNEVVQGLTSTIAHTKSSQGNQAIVLADGATFVNNGLFSVKGDFDSGDIVDSGKFILGGGTVKAVSIRGDYYASGALAWGSPEVRRGDGEVYASTEYSNQYDTYQMFKTDNMYADMKSNSAMFDVVLTKQDSNGYYGVKMNRISFYNIVENPKFAQYLENNYTDVGKTEKRTDLYEAYKLVTNTSDLNKAVRKTFGETIYPTLSEQNYKIAKLNNKKMKEELFSKKSDKDVGEYSYVGYATHLDIEDRKSDNFSENDMKYSAVSIGVDKKINKAMRVGVLGTIGKTNIKFDDGATRKDETYQLNMFSIYEKDSIKGTANLYVGKIQGDLERKLSVTSIQEEMKGDLESRYYGLNLSLEKEYKFNKINLSPRVELNTIYMKEDRVKETGDYALDVNGVNGNSVEVGTGFATNRTFCLKKGYKITPEVSVMYYNELGNQYKDRSVKLKSVSGDTVGIRGYNEGKNTGEFNINTVIEKEGFSGRMGINYEVTDQGEEIVPYVSLGYIL